MRLKTKAWTFFGQKVAILAVSWLVVLCPHSGAAERIFRNHPGVIPRPIICSAVLLSSDQSELSSLFTEPLNDFLNRVKANSEGKLIANNERTTNKEKVDHIATLVDDVTNLYEDQFSGGKIYSGKTAIKEQLAKRKSVTEQLRLEVRQQLNQMQPDIRASHGLMIAVLAVPAYVVIADVIEAVSKKNYSGLIGDVAILATIGIMGAKIILEQLRQVGIVPVNSGTMDKYYDFQFMKHTDAIQKALESGDETNRIFTTATTISYEQLNSLKGCDQIDMAKVTAGTTSTCMLKRRNNFDPLFNESTILASDAQSSAKDLDPRWAEATVYVDDILTFDPKTREPRLMTFVRFFGTPQGKPAPPPPRTDERLNQFDLMPVPLR